MSFGTCTEFRGCPALSLLCVIVACPQKVWGDYSGLQKTSANPCHSPSCYGWGAIYESETQPGLLGMRKLHVYHHCKLFSKIINLNNFVFVIFFLLLLTSVSSREGISTSMIMCWLQHMKLVLPRLFPAYPHVSFLTRPPTLLMSPW